MRVRYYVLAILLLPAVALWRQDNALFNRVAFIDPWIYFGYFQNLVEFKRTLPWAPYYGTRLAWVLPGYVLHSILPAIPASVIFHLAVHWAASLALFTVLRHTAGIRTAFLTVVFFSLHPQLWAATGWDYFDGPGLAYCLASMAFFTRAAMPGGTRAMLAAGGAALAGMVYSNLFLVLFVPAAAATYPVLAWHWRGERPVRALTGMAVAAGAGAAGVTIVLGVINVLIEGKFWFYAPSFHIASVLASHNIWFTGIWLPEGIRVHLWYPLFLAVAALVVLAGCLVKNVGSRVPAALFSAQLLYGAGMLCYWQFLGGNPVLALYYYTSPLIPFAFLVAGAVFLGPAGRLHVRSFAALAAMVAIAFAAVWADPIGRLIPMWPFALPTMPALAGCLMAAGWILSRKHPPAVWVSAAGLLLLAAWTRPYLPEDPHDARRNLERIERLRKAIEAARGANPVVFWYDPAEPANLEYLALASTYVMPPPHPFPDACPAADVKPGTVVAVLSNRDGLDRIAAARLASCWHQQVLAARPLRTEPGAGYSMALLRVEDDLARWHPLQASFVADYGSLQPASSGPAAGSPLPASRWKPYEEGPDAAAVAGDLMTTCKEPGLPSFRYPRLSIPQDGWYRFTLKYTPVEGSASFEADVAGSEQLGGRAESRGAGGPRQIVVSARLKYGQAVQFILRNGGKGRPARFRAPELTAVRIDKDGETR